MSNGGSVVITGGSSGGNAAGGTMIIGSSTGAAGPIGLRGRNHAPRVSNKEDAYKLFKRLLMELTPVAPGKFDFHDDGMSVWSHQYMRSLSAQLEETTLLVTPITPNYFIAISGCGIDSDELMDILKSGDWDQQGLVAFDGTFKMKRCHVNVLI